MITSENPPCLVCGSIVIIKDEGAFCPNCDATIRTPIPRDREAFEDRFQSMFGREPPRLDPKEIEGFIVATTRAEWARVTMVAPGAMRLEVWPATLDLDRMLRIVNVCRIEDIGFSVALPLPLKRLQLRATFAIGAALMRLHEWIFDRLGGTWT